MGRLTTFTEHDIPGQKQPAFFGVAAPKWILRSAVEIVVQYSCYQDEHLISANLEHLYGFADRIVISFGAFRAIRKSRVLWGLPENGEWVDDRYTAARSAVGVPGWTICWGGEPELRAQVNANAIPIIGERLIEEKVQLLDVSWDEERLKAMKPLRENRGRDRDRQAERISADPGGRRRIHHLRRNREGTGIFSVRSRQQREGSTRNHRESASLPLARSRRPSCCSSWDSGPAGCQSRSGSARGAGGQADPCPLKFCRRWRPFRGLGPSCTWSALAKRLERDSHQLSGVRNAVRFSAEPAGPQSFSP